MILRCYRSLNFKLMCGFSSRGQNFFEINPIYPDNGDKDFDLYNVDRKKIPVLDAYSKSYRRDEEVKRKIKEKMYVQKQKKLTLKKSSVDKETGFPITDLEELNNYIEKFKKEKHLGLNIKEEFNTVLAKLIQRFETKSETQLIRLLRISLANAKKGSIKEQIRAQIIKEAVTANAANFRKKGSKGSGQKLDVTDSQLEEIAFQKALVEIDAKIQQAEVSLRYEATGLKKTLHKFDVDYGWELDESMEVNKDYSLITNRGPFYTQMLSSTPRKSDTQNWSIQRRISRLYFLERIKFLNNDDDKMQQLKRVMQFPINIRGADQIVNDLARQYKEAELEQVPDLADIYQDIDVVLNKVFMRQAPKKRDYCRDIEDRNTVEEVVFRKEDLIWKNIDVDEVFTPELYLPESLDEKDIQEVTPHADAEMSLNRLPFNLYRHTQLEVFGVFNKYKKFILKNFLNNDTVDTTSQFRVFSLEQAKQQLGSMQNKKQRKLMWAARAKRKTSIATITMKEGDGKVFVNGGPLGDYFPWAFERGEALKALIFTQTSGMYDIDFQVYGGGNHSQSQACMYALARCLIKVNPENQKVLAQFGLTGSDCRRVQRKRIGLYSARVRPPFVRR